MKIMLCYDGSDEAQEGINEAIKQAKAFQAKIYAVTCVKEFNKDYPKIMEPIYRDHQRIQEICLENKIPCEVIILYRPDEDRPGEYLLAFAKENKIDQIIIGVKSRSKVGKLIFGSVAEYLLLRSECPILSVRLVH